MTVGLPARYAASGWLMSERWLPSSVTGMGTARVAGRGCRLPSYDCCDDEAQAG